MKEAQLSPKPVLRVRALGKKGADDIRLNYWTIIISAFVGTALCCAVLLFNSRGPMLYHIGFPVYVRATAGVYGARVAIFIRMIVAIFYMGTQT